MSPAFSESGSTIESPVEPRSEFHYYTKIQQSDLVPTISSLLGWTIPRNNLGVLLRSFVDLWRGLHPFFTVNHKIERTNSPQLALALSKCPNQLDFLDAIYLPMNILLIVLEMMRQAVLGVAASCLGIPRKRIRLTHVSRYFLWLDLISVPSCFSSCVVLGIDRLSRLLHVLWSRNSTPQHRSSRTSRLSINVPQTFEV